MFSELTGSQLLIVFGSILLAMAIHEAMHAFTSHWLGDTTAKEMGRLTLNPLKHIDALTTVLLPMVLILLGLQPFFIAKPVPFNPDQVRHEEFGAALIGIAGPLTNLVLAIVAAGIIRISGAAIGTNIFEMLSIFMQVNIGLFVFNMIPFPPLDGSRLLYAFAPEPVQRLMYQVESMGLTAILIFMFLLYPLISPVVINIMSGIYSFLLG
ncbi:site-2 protease family protein [Candidatus Saccharibacteria bacterium]|nr:MAG: site-2 protease family protein [Candidatus Saccharibacteria bacterium]